MRIPGLSGLFTSLLFLGPAAAMFLWHPETPLPDHWNPTQPLVVTDPVTPLTSLKMDRALNDPEQCLSVLENEGIVSLSSLTDTERPGCGITQRKRITSLRNVTLRPVETDCRVALRLAMWLEHDVRLIAQQVFKESVATLNHLSSYSCRPIRTSSGNGARLSTHATAMAIDITGFQLGDGRLVDLTADWDGDDENAVFLRRVRDGACRWFGTVLGPDFNELHADHFHLQARGRGLCR